MQGSTDDDAAKRDAGFEEKTASPRVGFLERTRRRFFGRRSRPHGARVMH